MKTFFLLIMAGLWRVIIPAGTTNLITNPSLETNTTGWTAAGSSSIARAVSAQYKGAWSLGITPTAGANDGAYTTAALSSGTTYTWSVYVKGQTGVPYVIFITTTGDVLKGTTTTFTGDGNWHRYSVTWQADATATFRFKITKNSSADTNGFFVDAAQVEAQTSATTYCDGDQDGCSWLGTPHGSGSKRDPQSRAGGTEVNLDTYNLFVEEPIGIGMLPVKNVATPSAILGTSQYQRTVVQPRTFSLRSYSVGTSLADLHAQRKAFLNAINPWGYATQQPVQFRYAGNNRQVLLDAFYRSGGEYDRVPSRDGFNTANSLTFEMFLPLVREDAQGGAQFNVLNAVASASYLVQRDGNGNWSALGTGPTGGATAVRALTYLPTGDLIAGGVFGTMGGVSNTSSIARWDGTQWNAMGTGAGNTGSVLALATGADGSLYAAGLFGTMGGVGNTSRISKWNGSAWTALGTGISGGGASVNALVFDSAGNLYAAGSFTTAGGVAVNNIAKWNGSNWSALGSGITGISNGVYALAADGAGNIYAGGDFTTAGGIAVGRIAKWNGSAWSALGSGVTGGVGGPVVQSLAVTPDGLLYAGGLFATAGGIAVSNLARWNGVGWSGLSSGVDSNADALVPTAYNLIIGGGFNTAGGLSLPSQHIVIWQSNAFIPLGVQLPATTVNIYTVAYTPRGGGAGALTLGFDTAGTVSASQTTINNGGTTDTFPVFTIKGPTSGTGAVYYLINWTTGQFIWFNNLSLISGETATLDLRQGKKTFTSDFRGNLMSYVVPGSDIQNWRLLPGNNVVSLLCGDATMAAWAWFPINHLSADGAN